jgi:flagellar motor component MotA
MIGLLFFFLFARNVMGDIPILVNFKSAALVFVGTLVGGLLAFPVHTLRGFSSRLFLPIAGKFGEHIRREALMLSVVFDGVVAVCDQRPPLEIAHSLKSYAEADCATPQPMLQRPLPGWRLWGNSAKSQNLAR